MEADRKVVGEEAVAEGTLQIEGVMKMTGLMMIRGVATTLMARAVPIMIGEILGTNLSRCHASLRAIL